MSDLTVAMRMADRMVQRSPLLAYPEAYSMAQQMIRWLAAIGLRVVFEDWAHDPMSTYGMNGALSDFIDIVMARPWTE